jgi:hypothetical protein
VADGGREWLPLKQAFERFADSDAREEYESAQAACRGIPRRRVHHSPWLNAAPWSDVAPQRLRAPDAGGEALVKRDRARQKLLQSFYVRLSAGELTCRARDGSPWGPWCDVPADAWAALRVENWASGILKVPTTGHQLFSAQVAALSLPQGGSAEPDTMSMAAPAPAPAADSTTKRKTFPPAAVTRWYTQEWIPCRLVESRPPSREEESRAAEEKFPRVGREFLRKLRREFAPAEWHIGGPRGTAKQPKPKPGSK